MSNKTTAEYIEQFKFKAFCYNGIEAEHKKTLEMMNMTDEFNEFIQKDDFYQSENANHLVEYMLEKMNIRDALKASAVLSTKASEALSVDSNNRIASSIKENAVNKVGYTYLTQDGDQIAPCVYKAPEKIWQEFAERGIEIVADIRGIAPVQLKADIGYKF